MIMKITNPKIEKQREEIGRTKDKISELQTKLRDQEKHLRNLEDQEIIAKFRKERMNDENLGAFASDVPRRAPKTAAPPADTEVSNEPIKEDTRNANIEN
jgi:septal ring factor EnvC (AmiA/AmiB activator)